MARAELHQYLKDPDRLRFFAAAVPWAVAHTPASSDSDFIATLRQGIYASRTGACFTDRDVDRFYASHRPDPMEAPRLAHLVSCAACLDAVNRRLGLRLLSGRD